MISGKEYKDVLKAELKKALANIQLLKAVNLFSKVLKAPAENLQASQYRVLAELYKENGAQEKREDVLFEALKIDPGNLDLNLEAAKIYEVDKNWQGVATALSTVYDTDNRLMSNEDFARYAIALLRMEKISDAEHVLKDSLVKCKQDENISYALGSLYISKQEWDRALSYLEEVDDTSEIGRSITFKAALGRVYRMSGNLDSAKMFLGQALEYDAESHLLWTELAETYFAKAEWKNALAAYKKVIEGADKVDATIYSRKRLAEVKLGDLAAAEATLRSGLAKYPRNIVLNNALAKVYIAAKDWDSAIEQLDFIKNEFKGESYKKSLLDLAMLYRNKGEEEKAEATFAEFHESNIAQPIKSYKEGYRTITLFDNGECRIDFHKKLLPAKALCITFDTINNTWNDEPFAHRFLKRQDVDIVTVTKRKRPDRYQDLSKEEFYEAIHKLAGTYKRVITYGSSIGAYSALYYGSSIDAQAIAMAPRNSGHPIFGKNQVEGEFQHELHPPVNEKIAPYIIYDPNNILDNKYVNESLSKTYPNAKFIKAYHAGHNCVSHFFDIGILKDFIVSIIHDEEVPVYEHSKMKWRSRQYLRVLGTACLNHNKPRWALDLGTKAFELYPEDIAVNIFRIRAIKSAKGLEKAINASKEAIDRIKNHQKIKLNLIDLYIQGNQYQAAEALIEDGINTYKNPKEFEKKRKKYENLFSKQHA